LCDSRRSSASLATLTESSKGDFADLKPWLIALDDFRNWLIREAA
jgi:hypothetical protein